MNPDEAPTAPDTFGLNPERNAQLIRNLAQLTPTLREQILGRSK